jgi:hypothetical protein
LKMGKQTKTQIGADGAEATYKTKIDGSPSAYQRRFRDEHGAVPVSEVPKKDRIKFDP